MEQFDVIVIGQGYAGLTAARLSAERGLRTLNIEQNCMGGLILNINELDPAPEGAEHNGAELASGLAMSNMEAGIEAPTEAVTSVVRNGEDWQVNTDSGSYAGQHVIIASGAKLRKLDIAGEDEFFGQGVSECADCDGPMFRNMETVVVGGGDSAFQEAAALAQFASKVTMVMRAELPARQELIDRVISNPKIVQIFETEVTEIKGAAGTGVESVQLRSANGSETTLPTSGVFIFIGLVPNASFAPEQLERDQVGAIKTKPNGATTETGLWVIGAARSGFGGLLTDAEDDARRTIEAINN